MAASRWNVDFSDMFYGMENEDADYEEIIFQSDDLDSSSGSSAPLSSADPQSITTTLPDVLPILPLRGLVVYPQTAVPLTIGQPRSIRLIDDVVTGEKIIGLIASRQPELENPGPEHLFQTGTAALIHRMFRAPDGTIRLLVQGMVRFKVVEYTALEPYLQARIEPIPDAEDDSLESEALARNVRDQFEHIAEMIPSMPRELVASISAISDSLQTVYTIANLQRMDIDDAQEILEIDPVNAKLHKLVTLLTRESEVLELSQKIQKEARSEIDKVQREYFLREQLKAIQKELGDNDEQAADVDDFRQKIEQAKMPEEADKMARRELDRLSRLPTAAAEYGVIRTYLDWLVSLPWSTTTEDDLDIRHARQVLDQDHYGLNDIKDRILEYLAVRKLRLERKDEDIDSENQDFIRRQREGVILCFAGPPGVGKTSLGQSISRAMGRKFIRISLGGVRDEAEIRGHRRTYIGAMPGRILQALRRAGSSNPVFMLDEIDKLSSDFRGDPSSALLEVLDPEQNSEFRENYLEVPFDLSQVMFITTANQLETIPGPLLDRMEVIQLSGYTENEKIEIAKKYLIPRQLKENSLHPDEIEFSHDSIAAVIRHYTREAGVRNLEREIGGVCRKIATQISEGLVQKAEITPDKVTNLLGRPKFFNTEEVQRRTELPGVATGLAWTPVGGEVLFIEATRMPGGKGFNTTGSVGKVMLESSQAALSFVRSHAESLGIDPKIFEISDIHMHIPAGAQPKDGPSAGVTMATALVSLLTGRLVHSDVGMTGEITLRGQVLPVGGIKEKVLAAHRAGLHTIILPRQNEADLDDLPEEVHQAIHFIPVDTVDEVLKSALDSTPVKDAQSQKEAVAP
jgi:ATP-dependent Lon protease